MDFNVIVQLRVIRHQLFSQPTAQRCGAAAAAAKYTLSMREKCLVFVSARLPLLVGPTGSFCCIGFRGSDIAFCLLSSLSYIEWVLLHMRVNCFRYAVVISIYVGLSYFC